MPAPERMQPDWPIETTERLALRPCEERDLDALHELYADARVTRVELEDGTSIGDAILFHMAPPEHGSVERLEPRNTASARVFEKLGMRKEGHLVENECVKGEWQSEAVYAILDREWR